MLRRRALVLGAPALIAGCAAPPQTAALRARRPAGVPARVELEATPFFPQTDDYCGPAALATVLAAAGRPATPEALADEVFLPARGGTLQLEMLAGARRHGAVPVPLPPRLDALMSELAAGTPPVVLLNLALSWFPRWHYAVVVGHDAEREVFVLRSGEQRRAVFDFAPFERTWARGGHWAFVALPPGRLPASADAATVTEAIVAFERVAPAADAARAYAAANARWPQELTLAMGLGNTRYASGDLAGAAVAFEQAARSHESAAAWNNLARVQWERGQRDAARAAARQALQRARASEPRWLDAARATAAAVGVAE